MHTGLLVRTSDGKKPLEKVRHRWKNNAQMDLQEVGWRAWAELIWLSTGTGCGLL